MQDKSYQKRGHYHVNIIIIIIIIIIITYIAYCSKGEKPGCEELLHWAQILREMLHNA